MEYAFLGNTDIKVSRICIGCMSFGKAVKQYEPVCIADGLKLR